METAKEKLKNIIKEYNKEPVFFDEREAFKKGMRIKQKLQKDKFSDMTKHSDTLIRPLTEMPETLESIINLHLNEAEILWLNGDKNNKPHGRIWLAKTFKEFRVAERV